ncbi:MAG TPA: D-arabinono-1,4-lactone oxidase [Pyrinomonadaceae bacterium]|nr:D-arabinono-1,4-lactone oxidase [Pyrinomonadaceae bacterium]
MANNSKASIHSPSAPIWQNWSGNLVHNPASDGTNYYFMPTNLNELKQVLADVAKIPGATIRVSGQRHSQPPLVIADNRNGVPQTTTEYLVDMSCYADLGTANDQRLVLGPGTNQVTVNAGVREDELDAFLTSNNLMMKTVTAGGFFSLGGMTAVDVHGGTMDAPIFAETVAAFNILLADGTVKTIDAQSPKDGGWSPLQFARVSLGGLGIVTSLTVNVLSRPYATTLQGGSQRLGLADKSAFVQTFKTLVGNHSRLETFFTPYATATTGFPLYSKNFLALHWDVKDDPSPKTPNQPPNPEPPSACALAGQQPPVYGATYLSGFAQYGADAAQQAQYVSSPGNTPEGFIKDGFYNPSIIAAITFDVVEPEVATANKAYSEMWLTGAVRVIFMSYYVPLPNLDDAGLGKVWDGLDVVSQIVLQDNNFHIAAPMEFRFVKGGDSAMSATYTEDPANTWFINLDLIGFVQYDQTKPTQYTPQLMQFFADVERQWVAMGGFPHNGKVYGFYDPTAGPGTYSATGPFNKNFLADLRQRRGARLEAFDAYRKQLDQNGLFYNGFLRQVLEP